MAHKQSEFAYQEEMNPVDIFTQEELPPLPEPVTADEVRSPSGGTLLAGGKAALQTEDNGLNVINEGYFRSGMKDYNNGKGWWLGMKGGVPKFSLGQSGGSIITWDGSTLSIVGNSNISKYYTAGNALTANDAVYLDGYQSDGGVTFDSATNGAWSADGSGNVTITTPITVGSNSNRILVLVIEVNTASNPDGSTWKWDGVTMTSTDSAAQFPAGGGYMKGYYLVAPNTGAKNITATSMGASTSGRYTLYSYYNAKQTGQLDGHGIQTGTTSASVSITPTTAGSLFWACLIDYDSTSGITASSGFTNNIQNGSTGVQLKAGDAGNITVIRQQTASVTGTGANRVGCIALSITPQTTAVPSVKRSNASALTTSSSFIGFASTSASAGAQVLIYVSGDVSGFTGLTFASNYYLTDVAGQIGTSPGTNTRKVGIATSTTTLVITNIW